MTQTYGPFATGSGASLGQSFWIGTMGPILQGEGVLGTYGSTTAQVYANSSGLKVFVRPGNAHARGVAWSSTADIELDPGVNGSGALRVDRIVLRMDPTGNTMVPFLIVGTPGGGPPALTQNAGGTWDIPLAYVNVAPGVSTINPSDVTDVRQFLPHKIRPLNSLFGLPAADGSAGFLAFDHNPSSLGLIYSNGTSWVSLKAPYDSGWQAYDCSAQGWGGVFRYRLIGETLNLSAALTKVDSVGDISFCVIPSGLIPYSCGGAWIPAATSVRGGAYEPGFIYMAQEGTTDVRVTAYSGAEYGRIYRLAHSFLIS